MPPHDHLTENPSALRRWVVSGPETIRINGEFEASIKKKHKTDLLHHEQIQHTHVVSVRDVKSLTEIRKIYWDIRSSINAVMSLYWTADRTPWTKAV